MTRFARCTLLLVLLLGCSRALGEGVTPFADVLLWHASEETSAVWSSTIAPFTSPQMFSANDVEFDWDAGYRLGFAHNPGEQSWDVKLYWTHFRTSEDIATAGGMVVPEFFSGFVSGDAGDFNGGELDWSLTFNTIDLEAGRAIALGESVLLRPSLGLKAALIDQKILANWSTDDSLPTDPAATEHVDHEFRGCGPSFGIDARWTVPSFGNLSLVGAFSGAFLWGVWNVDDLYARNDAAFPENAYGSFTTSMKDSSLGTLNLNYFLGLEWIRPGEITIAGRLGYELQWWANQQRLSTFQQLPMHGDLTLQGLTCGISVGF